MIDGYPITIFILLWSAIVSVVWTFVCYSLRCRQRMIKEKEVSLLIMPSLVIGPFLLLVSYHFLSVNLILPISMTSNPLSIFLYCFIPSMVLSFSSGVFLRIKGNIVNEYLFWKRKPFCQVILSFGLSPEKNLRKLVAWKSYAEAWGQALPWFFGELIVVEGLFNAPGLGYQIWQHAKKQNFTDLFESVLWLFMIYAVLFYLIDNISRKIGRRLETYS